MVIDISLFDVVFEPLHDKRVGYVIGDGNVGDDLINAATFQLMDKYDIDYDIWLPGDNAKYDVLTYSGGGNMGSYYPKTLAVRREALKTGIPVIILPQSFMWPEDLGYYKVYARELASLELCDGILAPDLALGYEADFDIGEPIYDEGLFLRGDREGLFGDIGSIGDPIYMVKDYIEYVELASRYNHVITDRLHFAISGLLCNRKVTILPNSYHKNMSMYETWLKDLGCNYSDSPILPSVGD